MEQFSGVVTNVIDSSTCIKVEATNGISFPPVSENDLSGLTYVIHLPTGLEQGLTETESNFISCLSEVETGLTQIPVDELKYISNDITSFTELTNLDNGKISKVNGISSSSSASGGGHSSSALALEPENGSESCTIANVLFAPQIPTTTTNGDLSTCHLEVVTEEEEQKYEVNVDFNGEGECDPLLELLEDKCESCVVKQGKMKEEPRSTGLMGSTSRVNKLKAETPATRTEDWTCQIPGPIRTYVKKKAVSEQSTTPPPAPLQRSKKPVAAKSSLVVPRKPAYSRAPPDAATPTGVFVPKSGFGERRDSVSLAASTSARKRKLVVDAQKQINNVEFKKQLLETKDIVQEPMAMAPTTKVAMKYLESGGVAQFFTSPGRVIRNVPLSKLYQTKLVTAMESYSTNQADSTSKSQFAVLDSSCLKILDEDGCSSKTESSNELAGVDGPSLLSKQRQPRTPKLTCGSLEAAFKQYTYHTPLVFKECERIRGKSKSARRLPSQLEKRISCKNNSRKVQSHSCVSVIKVEIGGDEEPSDAMAIRVKDSSKEQHSQFTPPTGIIKSEEAVPVSLADKEDSEMINVYEVQIGKVEDEFVLP